MENEILDLLIQSGDSGVLLIVMLVGWTKFTGTIHSIDTRLTVIETLLKEKRDTHRAIEP